jgi:hypothetical protein
MCGRPPVGASGGHRNTIGLERLERAGPAAVTAVFISLRPYNVSGKFSAVLMLKVAGEA